MPYVNTKDRTVFSPVNPVLEPLYQFIEQYQKTFSGSNFFDELIENYEYLDQMLAERKEKS